MAGVQFYLPIPIVHTLSCTGALFVFAIQYFYGGVKITRQQGISVLIAFSGILLTVNGR
jgi:drug/metabolite transporter (DMT)-like permease